MPTRCSGTVQPVIIDDGDNRSNIERNVHRCLTERGAEPFIPSEKEDKSKGENDELEHPCVAVYARAPS